MSVLLSLVCGYYIGSEQRHCGSTRRVRVYIAGPRCSWHTPAAVAAHFATVAEDTTHPRN